MSTDRHVTYAIPSPSADIRSMGIMGEPWKNNGPCPCWPTCEVTPKNCCVFSNLQNFSFESFLPWQEVLVDQLSSSLLQLFHIQELIACSDHTYKTNTSAQSCIVNSA